MSAGGANYVGKAICRVAAKDYVQEQQHYSKLSCTVRSTPRIVHAVRAQSSQQVQLTCCSWRSVAR